MHPKPPWHICAKQFWVFHLTNRLFIAAEIPENIREVIAGTRDEFAGKNNFKWEPMDKMHLTLKFLGDCTIEQTGEIEKYVEGLKRESVIDTALMQFGTFTKAGKPIILFAELVNSPLLQNLQHNIEISMSQLGFPTETRKFHPHITLLRVKDFYDFKTIGKIANAPRFDIPFVINEICLYQSVLLSSGSKYVKKASTILE